MCFQDVRAPELANLLLLLKREVMNQESPERFLPLSKGSFSGITQRGGTALGQPLATAASCSVPFNPLGHFLAFPLGKVGVWAILG